MKKTLATALLMSLAALSAGASASVSYTHLGSTMSKMAGVDDATCTPTSNNLIAGLNQ